MAAAEAKEDEGIVWNESRGRFESLDKKSYLVYVLKSSSSSSSSTDEESVTTMDILHTYVPSSARGQGLASRLCTAAFRHARDRRYSVIPTCSYVSETFLPRNPSWKPFIYTEDKKSSL
ncbi:Acetyltransferase [Acorus gramineus]|uniref:Acetyltransferase n=1 Tax=Acorus gramineus TaxID=55184 RepID=A0AAV9BJL2_ACOGR|nr:Acetyltransferase [Acorus gramineus]